MVKIVNSSKLRMTNSLVLSSMTSKILRSKNSLAYACASFSLLALGVILFTLQNPTNIISTNSLEASETNTSPDLTENTERHNPEEPTSPIEAKSSIEINTSTGTAEPNQQRSSAKVDISTHSSVQSSSGLGSEHSSEQSTKVYTNSTDEGNSTLKYRIVTDEDSEVEVRERNGRTTIKVKD